MSEEQTAPATAPRVNSHGMPDRAAEIEAKLEADQLEAKKEGARVKALANERTAKASRFHPLRPLQLTGAFIGGTITGTVDGVARGARYGLLSGIAGGVLYAVAVGTGGLGLGLFVGVAVGVGAMMALGAGVGLMFGGAAGVRRELKREEQEDARGPNVAAQRTTRTSTVREIREDQRTRTQFNFDRSQQQDRENARDSQTYWQDRVGNDSSGWSMGR